MERSDVEGVVGYAIKWPLSQPVDAYRAGRKHSWLRGLLRAVVPGIPKMLIRLVWGPVIATLNYAKSDHD